MIAANVAPVAIIIAVTAVNILATHLQSSSSNELTVPSAKSSTYDAHFLPHMLPLSDCLRNTLLSVEFLKFI